MRIGNLYAVLSATLCFWALSLAGSAQASVFVHVDISRQVMQVYVDEELAFSWPVSTGRKGYFTPRGAYRPQELKRMHYSKKYDNAPMPYAVFFRGGFAIHGTDAVRRLGRPASHGCVRLATGNARELFYLIQEYGASNARIVIQG
jgi:lipoprotein-anchoring transpeptidase ErfK/SrfK